MAFLEGFGKGFGGASCGLLVNLVDAVIRVDGVPPMQVRCRCRGVVVDVRFPLQALQRKPAHCNRECDLQQGGDRKRLYFKEFHDGSGSEAVDALEACFGLVRRNGSREMVVLGGDAVAQDKESALFVIDCGYLFKKRRIDEIIGQLNLAV